MTRWRVGNVTQSGEGSLTNGTHSCRSVFAETALCPSQPFTAEAGSTQVDGKPTKGGSGSHAAYARRVVSGNTNLDHGRGLNVKAQSGSGGSSLRPESRRHDLGGAAPSPVERGHLLDRTALRHLQPGTGVGVIERERLAVAHDLLASDEHMPDRPLAGCIEQAADRIVKRLHRRCSMSTMRKSARAPDAIRPRSSRPSARAPPIVAVVKISAAPTACAWPAATRARIAAVRNSSTKLCGKVSVPIPRLTPAARYRPKSSSRIPRRENTVGQCATVVPVSARSPRSLRVGQCSQE